MRHNNPSLTANALRSALSIVNDELADCKRVLADSAEDECEWSERLMDELAELRIARRVLERLHHEAHMDALEEGEYEELRREECRRGAIPEETPEDNAKVLAELAADLRALMDEPDWGIWE